MPKPKERRNGRPTVQCPGSVIETLLAEAYEPTTALYRYYEWATRVIPSVGGWQEQLGKFLGSTMDEVRLRRAQDLAKTSLRIHDIHDADHFREGVLRREASGDIAYERQRDHSAHTVYNWLIGWYFYQHVPAIRKALEQAGNVRAISGWDVATFGGLWQICSVLHDVGYLFEGSLSALDPAPIAKQPQIGLGVLKDYFHHRLWLDFGWNWDSCPIPIASAP